MLVNCRGFSLVEVLASFSILLVLVTVVVPLLMKVHQERTMIDYKREAVRILHNERETRMYDSPSVEESKEIISGARKYQFTTLIAGNLVKICIAWEGPGSDYEQLCTYTSK